MNGGEIITAGGENSAKEKTEPVGPRSGAHASSQEPQGG